MAVPVQLRDWHRHVQAVKAKNPHLSHKEALQVASDSYHGVAKRKPARKRGAGFLSDLAHGIGAVANVAQAVAPVASSVGDALGSIGLGRRRVARKPAPKRKAPAKRKPAPKRKAPAKRKAVRK